ncbi:VOC family protein [Fodinibius halophilus]|uniref:VOC family protein n=1 Tax=Fodinibius halophilus TaxID=1736908 RepID=A0A6M1TEP1_9BACT|nr:VOC family protein [Fodinibius halophilus]NGP87110.1 VOC family protein [Fodinibius halophilus]
MTTRKTNRISTCLWFDDQAEEAASFYVSIFENAEILNTTPYYAETPSEKPKGSVMTVDFELEGQGFTALNGGPHFTPNPSISFFINCETEEEVDRLWNALSENGNILMPLDSYPFSEKYGWAQDKYGVSWQIMISNWEHGQPPKLVPSLMFNGRNTGKAKEAIDYYLSVFRDSQRGMFFPYGPDQQPNKEGTAAYADFMLENQWFAAMDSALDHDFTFGEAISLMINCDTQEEIDYYWEKLSADPEAEQCGWLKDKFGVSWQIVPTPFSEMLENGTKEQSERLIQAMLKMKKLDIAKLERAYKQEL